MGRAYVRVSPEIILDLLKGKLFIQRADGSFHKITSTMPEDAKAVRAWPANSVAVLSEGDIGISFDSEHVTNVPGEAIQEHRVQMSVESGFQCVVSHADPKVLSAP